MQPLTPELAIATRAPRGVVVAEVEAEGPADGVLRPGDVITAMNDVLVDDPDRFLMSVALLPLEPVGVTVVRAGAPMAVSLTPIGVPREGTTPPPGVRFERVPGAGTRVVEDSAPGALPGTPLRPGDVVVAAGDAPDPTPVQIRRLLEAAPAGTGVVFTVRREGQQFVVVIHPPADRDVP